MSPKGILNNSYKNPIGFQWIMFIIINRLQSCFMVDGGDGDVDDANATIYVSNRNHQELENSIELAIQTSEHFKKVQFKNKIDAFHKQVP